MNSREEKLIGNANAELFSQKRAMYLKKLDEMNDLLHSTDELTQTMFQDDAVKLVMQVSEEMDELSKESQEMYAELQQLYNQFNSRLPLSLSLFGAPSGEKSNEFIKTSETNNTPVLNRSSSPSR